MYLHYCNLTLLKNIYVAEPPHVISEAAGIRARRDTGGSPEPVPPASPGPCFLRLVNHLITLIQVTDLQMPKHTFRFWLFKTKGLLLCALALGFCLTS